MNSYLKHLKENKNFVHEESKLNKYAYLKKISNYKYVFSPRGLGIDTHIDFGKYCMLGVFLLQKMN